MWRRRARLSIAATGGAAMWQSEVSIKIQAPIEQAYAGASSRCSLGYGDLTGVHEEIRAGILARLLPDVHVCRFPGIHHFVPPEEIYSPDHVEALREHWVRAETALVAG